MDFNLYAPEKSAAGRLADLRAASAQAALIRTARIGPRGVGPVLGGALIRLGHWLAPHEAGAPSNPGGRVARRAEYACPQAGGGRGHGGGGVRSGGGGGAGKISLRGHEMGRGRETHAPTR